MQLPVVGQDMTYRGACPHDCPDTCAWTIRVEQGRAVQLRGDPDHPLTAGGLCSKVNHYLEDRLYSPDRVLHPLRRTGAKGTGAFDRITWDEALDEIAGRIRRVTQESGAEAVLPYSYMGTQGMVQGMAMHARFFARLGATRLDRTICGDNAQAGFTAALGTDAGIDPEDIVHSRFILIWGSNTVVTNLHLWPLVLRARKEHGARIAVVDPIRTRTAAAADAHVQLLPGSDAALALGMMHVIVAEGLHDAEYIQRHTIGFDQLAGRLEQYPPERAAELTGLVAADIVELARQYATTRPAVIRSLVGMDHRDNGAMTFRTIACLPALTGAWRDRGGGIAGMAGRFMRTALPMDRLTMPELEDPSLRLVNIGRLGEALTDDTMAPPIRVLVVYNSNPAVIAPNQNLVMRGLARTDLFTVVHEHFMTDTARYADIVLPATTQAEHLDLMYSWGHAYVSLNVPVVPPQGEAIPNSQLYRQLAQRLGLDHPELQESDEDIIRSVLDSDHPYAAGVTWDRLVAEGWVKLALPADFRPFADGGFATPSGRCELFSQTLADAGMDPLPAYEPAAEGPAGDPDLLRRFPLALMAGKGALRFLNSSYSGVARHLAAEKEPLLDMSPADAAARSISDGDLVRVFNDRGSVELRTRLGTRVRPGVVSLPFGWWPSHMRNGQSANALTNDGIGALGRGPTFLDTLVQVERVGVTP